MKLFCCSCQKDVAAKLYAGGSFLPNGYALLGSANYWACPICNHFVACKKGTKTPYGTIQTPEIKSATFTTLALIEAMKEVGFKYGDCSGQMTKRLGYTYRQQSVKVIQEPLIARIALVKHLASANNSKQAKVKEILRKKLKDCRFLDEKRPSLNIFCCHSSMVKIARLVLAKEMKKKPKDSKPDSLFWVCDCCGNYVGCSESSGGIIKPLGVIATPEIRAARIHIHNKLDAIWRLGYMSRTKIYEHISDRLGIPEYHTANITDIAQARNVYRILNSLSATFTPKQQLRINELANK